MNLDHLMNQEVRIQSQCIMITATRSNDLRVKKNVLIVVKQRQHTRFIVRINSGHQILEQFGSDGSKMRRNIIITKGNAHLNQYERRYYKRKEPKKDKTKLFHFSL